MALRVELHRFEPNTSNERISHTQSNIQHILSERQPHLAAHYYVARDVFRGRFLSLEPKDGESWGVSGYLFEQDNPNLGIGIDEAIGELIDDINANTDGLGHGGSDGDTSDEDGEEGTPIAPYSQGFSPDVRGRTTGIFGRSEPTAPQSPRRHQAVRGCRTLVIRDEKNKKMPLLNKRKEWQHAPSALLRQRQAKDANAQHADMLRSAQFTERLR